MSPRTNSKIWQALQSHQTEIATVHMRDLFSEDPCRYENFSFKFNDIILDYSKNRITRQSMQLLTELAEFCAVPAWRERMFAGEKINITEQRAVLHTALRNRSTIPVYVNGENVMPAIYAVLNRMRLFTEAVRQKIWLGYTGKAITSIVNIGIGGSDLGPMMACTALQPYASADLRVYFVSNVDGAHLSTTLQQCNPETTLFVVASKTFTTHETLTNAYSARQWFLNQAIHTAHICRHFVAVSTNAEAVTRFGIDTNNMFEFWDWVGGRYSMWSAVGLSIALYLGMDHFEALLQGAYEMDQHFRHAPLDQNMPVILAMLGVWYQNFFHCKTQAILPYDQSLLYLANYLQQSDMESNGKSVDRDGHTVNYSTGSVVWGQPGTNGQHAFYQLIHQGSEMIPCDFIIPITSHYPLGNHHQILFANFLAQSKALMQGKTREEATTDLLAEGWSQEDIKTLLPHKIFPGNRPSNSIVFQKLTPKTLGSLVALYEHKIFVQGVVWNLNSFDQWGVELGKKLAHDLLPDINAPHLVTKHDSSTNGLIRYFKAAQTP